MKLGKINISSQLVMDEYSKLSPLFSKFTPIHVEREFNIGNFIYTGLSDLFDNVEQGQIIPFYNVTLTNEEDKSITLIVSKIQ